LEEEDKVKESICHIAKLIYDKDLSDSCGGNVSVRKGDKVYITPRRSGENYQWSIEPDSIIVTDLCEVPISGDINNISREAIIHYYIYQNFSDINSIFHAHPFFIMVFGSAHLEIPTISEATRHYLGTMPISCIEELVPGTVEMAEKVVENFKLRRKANPPTPALLCNLPFHGVFVASKNIHHTFITLETAERNAKMLIYRQLMFGNNSKADFSIHKELTKEERDSIEDVKEVCKDGFCYRDASGNMTTYGERQRKQVIKSQNISKK
jgi:ribulose-5-phosphate 4-epimerase/fuculose-1-phosphate aldolase